MDRLKRLKHVPWLFVIGGSLFVPAGTLAWPQGWIFLAEFIGGMLVTMFWLKRHDRALFEERVNNPRRSDQPLWDKLFGLSMMVAWYGWIIVMSLDKRWGWSQMPVGLAVLGAILIPAGYLFAASALKANSFAATVVRLQEERGQIVVDTGPYAFVRHPMYTGSVIVHIGTALLLGSVIGLAFVIVLTAMLGVRAVFEEHLLRDGLPGYDDYIARVRWRLIPGVW
jgi:protein-S-isoprenylcysteine O-methyltransferase Ste14